MSSEPKITIEEDVQEHVLEAQPIRVKDYRLAFLLCYGLPILISVLIGVRNGGALWFLFGLSLLFPLGKLSYEVIANH